MNDTLLEGSGGVGPCDGCYNGSDSDYWAGLFVLSHSELVTVTMLSVPLLLLGLLGNILTILVVWLRPQMRSTTYLYLSSMAVSDIMMLALMPLDLYKLWWDRPWLLGNVVCKLSQFVSECCTFSSILHMTALGAERYVGVCFPFRARLLVTRRRVRMLIGCLWFVAVASASPVFVLVGAESVDGEMTECRITRWAESSGLIVAMLWLSNLYFIIPFTLLTLLYTLIARRLRRRKHLHRDHTHRQTLRMMVMIVCVFVVCWLPFHVARTLFCLSLGSSVQLYFLSQYLNLVSFVLFYLSAAVNPLLYNLMSSRYRDNVRALLRPHDQTRPLRAPSPSSPPGVSISVVLSLHQDAKRISNDV